jgi:phosphoribosyl 1,2-cyclic phosphodiesterase
MLKNNEQFCPLERSFRFTVLASGSAGNASLLQADGFGVLLDLGLGPRQLTQRLKTTGLSWQNLHAAILTHTHTDHWHDRTFAHLRRLRLPLYCHPQHHSALLSYSPEFAELVAANLVHAYEPDTALNLSPTLACLPFRVRHDGGVTCGFRFEGSTDLFGQPYALGYAADLGTWDQDLVETLSEVDVLALEFNHDVAMERTSGRSPRLIARVLGDRGHLSNDQAAALLCEVVRRSTPGRIQHLVQLHLSQDCNRPVLALATAQAALNGASGSIQIHTAHQDKPGPCLSVSTGQARRRPRRAPASKRRTSPSSLQPWLPGWEAD